MKFFGASNCRGRADTLKLQSKLSDSAVEQTGLRDYMASKVDSKCVGNEVGVAAQKIVLTPHPLFCLCFYTGVECAWSCQQQRNKLGGYMTRS